MRTKDLIVGESYRTTRGNSIIIVDTAHKWRKSTSISARQGNGIHIASPLHRANGVAVALGRTWVGEKNDYHSWGPEVVQPSQIDCTEADYQARKAGERAAYIASQERRAANRSEGDALTAMAATCGVKVTTITTTGYGYGCNFVISAADLRKLLAHAPIMATEVAL